MLKEFPSEGSCSSLDEQLLTFLEQTREISESNHIEGAIGVAWGYEHYWFYKKKTSKERFDIEELKPYLTILSEGDIVLNLDEQVLRVTNVDKTITSCNDSNMYYTSCLTPINLAIQSKIDELLQNRSKMQKLSEANELLLKQILELYENSKRIIC